MAKGRKDAVYTIYYKDRSSDQKYQPLRIGDGDEGIILDSHMGKPMLPASGIVGAFRSYLEKSGEDQGQINKMFGIKETGEKAIFLSAMQLRRQNMTALLKSETESGSILQPGR